MLSKLQNGRNFSVNKHCSAMGCRVAAMCVY